MKIITVMEISGPNDTSHKLVVRQYGGLDRKAAQQIVRDEYKLLEILAAQQLIVPAPVYLDARGEFLAAPSMAMEFMEGDTDFAPGDLGGYLMQMADHLCLVHKLQCVGHDFSFLPSASEVVPLCWTVWQRG